MSTFRAIGIGACLTFVMLSVGCDEGELDKVKLESQLRQQKMAQIEATLSAKDRELARQVQDNTKLTEQVQDLVENIKQLETRLNQKNDRLSAADGAGDPGRVELLGAKAMAEYKLEQLNRKLESMTDDLAAKQAELTKSVQTAQEKEKALVAMKQTAERAKSLDRTKIQELESKLKEIAAHQQDSAAEEERLNKDLESKTKEVAELKNQIAQATHKLTDAQNRLSAQAAKEAQLQQSLETATNSIQDLKTQLASMKAELGSMTARLDEEKAAAARAAQEVNRLRAEAEELKSGLGVVSPEREVQTASSGEQTEQASDLERILQFPAKPRSAGGGTAHLY